MKLKFSVVHENGNLEIPQNDRKRKGKKRRHSNWCHANKTVELNVER